MLTGRTSYSRPVSSTMMWILCPLGVGQVCTSIIGNSFRSAVAPHTETQRRQLARPAGVEPTTPSLEGWCSIQFELRARATFTLQPFRRRLPQESGRGGEIRTPDILLPKQARYQTAPHPAG